MKSTILLLVTAFSVLCSCSEDENVFPDIAEGTYHLVIYNRQGIKVLERSGEAKGVGPDVTVRIDDPLFSSGKGDNEKFAMFLINSSPEYDRPWSDQVYWPVGHRKANAVLFQRFYGSSRDWGYESVSGYIRILEASPEHVKGSFRIRMHVRDATEMQESLPDFEWTANPEWGDHITIEGEFFSHGY